ncbi:hypothetical protein COB47_2050 [Caldicellulosiruptor obsidiansis OB47]|uniref:Uncharacterized protein n=1 Tax=Caldicellulosiruptor obsidiansis (strain ATCC BAA-2073 / JCM 16842 / OB47) TaxID=608506 RepID=D9TGI9_CALOO|nr:DUF5320 family protein [Caldicellulosiruptor obsidiansis]ADL43309.1 hypothetical protein COB47_2050 [Caldicellulosiruptor obsidiansis OB47]
MPLGYGCGFGRGAKGFGQGFGRGFSGSFGRGSGICKWMYLAGSKDLPFAKEALEYEKQVLEQRLKLIDKLLSDEQKQE